MLDADSRHQADVTGGKLSGLVRRNEGIEFDWQADCLPWVVPEECRSEPN